MTMINKTPYIFFLCILLFSFDVLAVSKRPNTDILVRDILIIGTNQTKDKLPGSGIYVDSDQLKKQNYSDLNQIASFVPGVYVREEDGYGLRPNIGIRGATSDRSQKITLMEDGVLIGPAPYSAPAAYYITNPSRLNALEVLKGPSVIRAGPHTVGGAVNLLTRPVSHKDSLEIDFTAGSHGYHNISAALTQVNGSFGILLEGLSYGSRGFKKLDGGGDTGFIRNDVNLKVRWEPLTSSPQEFVAKLGFAEEDADETYLGLSDDDFQISPSRRYRASQLDRFRSEHKQLHLSHVIGLEDNLEFKTKLYFNEFYRSWDKFNGFIDGPQAQDVLIDTGAYTSAYGTLVGVRDSVVGDYTNSTIDITDNDREYSSRGFQLDILQFNKFLGLSHALRVGIRYHEDEVRRRHKLKGYLMSAGSLIYDDIVRPYKTDNFAHTSAVALYVSDEIEWEDWTLNFGVRHEDIKGSVDNYLLDITAKNEQTITAPGIGLHRQLTSCLSMFGGVYVGFSPAGPGRSGADAEESVNQEYGVRFVGDKLSGELIAFKSDYDNLLGRCRASDVDCDIGQEFSGGSVEVQGLEMMAKGGWKFTDLLTVTARLGYTYSDAHFKESFLSQFSQWGLVNFGDELPYIPRHVGRLDISFTRGYWSFDFATKHQHEMREVPGAGPVEDRLHTETLTSIDLAVTRTINKKFEIQLLIRNVGDVAKIISHRPYGARPNAPRAILGRIGYQL